jgi:hypothetical protein
MYIYYNRFCQWILNSHSRTSSLPDRGSSSRKNGSSSVRFPLSWRRPPSLSSENDVESHPVCLCQSDLLLSPNCQAVERKHLLYVAIRPSNTGFPHDQPISVGTDEGRHLRNILLHCRSFASRKARQTRELLSGWNENRSQYQPIRLCLAQINGKVRSEVGREIPKNRCLDRTGGKRR